MSYDASQPKVKKRISISIFTKFSSTVSFSCTVLEREGVSQAAETETGVKSGQMKCTLHGLLEHRALSSDGACTECRERKWRASFVGVGGGICWNQKCITSPIFGRMRSFSDPYNINISNNESNMSNVVSGSSTARDYMTTAQNLVAAAAAAGGGGAKRHLSASVSVPVPIRVPHSAAMPGYVEKAHPVSPLESFGSKGTVRSVDSMASAHHSAFDVHRGRGAMPRVISSSSTSSVSSNSNSSSDMITDHRSTNSLHQLHQQQQQQDLSHTPGASDWEMGGKVVYATASAPDKIKTTFATAATTHTLLSL